jgi:transposase
MSEAANLEAANLLEEALETYEAQQPEVVVSKKEPGKRVKAIDRSQTYWGAIDIEKLIEDDHAARGIWLMVNRLDLTGLYAKIKAVEGRAGQNTWDPRLLMALWIYGYSEGISSARELSRMCGYEPGCQWLTAREVINHHTLSDFRVRYKEELDEIFVQVLGLLSAEGLVELKRIAHDGTKVRANASSHSFRREQRIREHLQMAREQVRAMGDPESEQLNQRAIQAQKRSRQEKQQRLEQALKELEEFQKTRAESEKTKVRVSETDPEARVMKQPNGGFGPSYNVQISTDAANGIIVAVDVTQAGNDCDQLIPAVEHIRANTGKTPEQILADGSYTMKNGNIEAMDKAGIDLIGPVTENNSDASLKRRGIEPEFYPHQFPYDEATDTVCCPAMKTLNLIRTNPRAGRIEYSYQASPTDCSACPLKDQCCPKAAARTVVRKQESAAVQAFRVKMNTDEAKNVYRRRAQIAEFPNAWIKDKLGIRQFRLRSRIKVRAEAVLACLTYNIQQWLRLSWRQTVQAVE